MARTGKIKWFNIKEGYGFIVPDNGGDDVFFHRRELPDDFDDIEADTPVTYVLAATSRGPMARHLQVQVMVTPARVTAPASPAEEGVWLDGVVKWFDPRKRYGFVVYDDIDHFLSWEEVKKSGVAVTELQPDMKLFFRRGPGKKPGSFAVTQLRLEKEEGEDASAAPKPEMRMIQRTRRPRKRSLELGQRAVGRVTKPPQHSYCFLRVLALLSHDGQVREECKEDTYEEVFLHASAFCDRWDDVCEGDDITFMVIEGQRAGQVAAGNALFYREVDEDVEQEVVIGETLEPEGPMAEQLAALLPAEPPIGSTGVGTVTSYNAKTGSGKVKADGCPPLSFTKTSVDAGVEVQKGVPVRFEVVGELKKGLKIRITGLAEDAAAEQELAAAQ